MSAEQALRIRNVYNAHNKSQLPNRWWGGLVGGGRRHHFAVCNQKSTGQKATAEKSVE